MTFVPALLLAQAATSPIRVYVGRDLIEFKKAQPIRKGGVVLIPLLPIVEKLGGTMIDGPLRRHTTVIVGKRRIRLSLAGGRSWVNGVPRHLKAAPWISKGQVVVPARFFADALGLSTTSDPRRGTLQIFPGGGMPSRRPAPPQGRRTL